LTPELDELLVLSPSTTTVTVMLLVSTVAPVLLCTALVKLSDAKAVATAAAKLSPDDQDVSERDTTTLNDANHV
jgi:hypothetical protein